MIRGGLSLSISLLVGLAAIGCSAGPPASLARLDPHDDEILAELVAIEDSRPTEPAGWQPLLDGLRADNPLLRAFAARSLGRLERPELVDEIAAALDDEDPAVRAAAADAVAQAVFSQPSEEAAEALRNRLLEESHPRVLGALGMALGRMRSASDAARLRTEEILVEMSRDAAVETLVPVARGLAAIGRSAPNAPWADRAAERLLELIRYGRRGAEGDDAASGGVEASPAEARALVRRLSFAALAARGGVDAETAEIAIYDPDVEVRRLATAAAARLDDDTWARQLIGIALADVDPRVRVEAIAAYARRVRPSEGCDQLLAALDDGNPHVELAAIDALGGGCATEEAGAAANSKVVTRLGEIAADLPGLPGPDPAFDGISPPVAAATSAAAPQIDWHRGAHALVSLASLDPAAAGALLPSLGGHPTWQVRMYAARAAATTGALDTLERLTEDPNPNVVNQAIRSLQQVAPRIARGAAISALQRADYQLLITAAGALEGAPGERALPALLDALERVSGQGRQTSRDTRRALLRRVEELGDADAAAALEPYLRDFDPLIARQAAGAIAAWTGEPVAPDPQPLPAPPPPSTAELRELAATRFRMDMGGGGVIEIEVYPFDAPTNAARFARQAREGYFEGLTFHRVVPNFVIQGGSPGANEYTGAGAFSRDELTPRPHLRGTIGISTRGRDTGDSQIFLNLVDNFRLDHNYTIIGAVVAGMDAVDAVLEGATIQRVTIAAPDR